MNKLASVFAATLMPFALATGCSEDDSTGDSAADTDGGNDTSVGGRMGIAGDIDGDMTLTADTEWVLEGIIFVRNGTLTIEPGTTILGTEGSALVIDTTAKLVADGTEDAPIVMTSLQANPARGDWGGLVLLGLATNNLDGGVGQAEGFANPPSYGGTDDSHSCGTLRYLRIEYAGFAISEGSELNGISFYSCGSQTVVDHVQVHMGADDGIEMFGGTFDAKYVIISGAEDDSIDSDEGYRGRLQYVFIHQDPSIGDNAFEWSNQGTNFLAQPLTGPTVANATVIGSGAGGDKSKGLTIKEGTEAHIFSSVMGNFTNELMIMSNLETQTVAEDGGVAFAGNLWFSHGGFGVDNEDGGDVTWSVEDFEGFVNAPGSGNMEADPMLASAAWGSPDITPAAASPVAGMGATPADGFFDATTYAGAVEPGGLNWTTAAWTHYGN